VNQEKENENIGNMKGAYRNYDKTNHFTDKNET
jgi:hypothetical protein